MRHAVIIGNGIAGFSAARQLRREDADLTISIFSDEAHPFYLRRHLKDYIAGTLGEYEMILESRNLYRRDRLSLFLQTPVRSIDVANREVRLTGGDRVHYDMLLLAMGSVPVPLEVQRADLPGVFSLRTLADAEAIRAWALRRHPVLVLGEGIVSLELAEGLARAGVEVHYSLLGDHLWPDVLDPGASALLQRLMSEIGVVIHHRRKVVRLLERGGTLVAAEMADGSELACRMVGHGCSFRPNIDILSDTPIACADGVIVNDRLETNVPGIYAAGDVVDQGAALPAEARLVRRWPNSFKQGNTAARNMLGAGLPVEAVAPSFKTRLCGVGVAVIGRGNLSEIEPGVEVEVASGERAYRRLVFEDDMLVGAILIGDTYHAAMLEQHIAAGTLRDDLGSGMLPTLLAEEPRLQQPMQASCPICTDAIRLPVGTMIGRAFSCRSCQSRLRLGYTAGRLGLVPETDEAGPDDDAPETDL